jgi:hypothetical protein
MEVRHEEGRYRIPALCYHVTSKYTRCYGESSKYIIFWSGIDIQWYSGGSSLVGRRVGWSSHLRLLRSVMLRHISSRNIPDDSCKRCTSFFCPVTVGSTLHSNRQWISTDCAAWRHITQHTLYGLFVVVCLLHIKLILNIWLRLH